MEFAKDALKSRKNAQKALAAAASALREVATDIDLFQQGDQVRVAEFGVEYAENYSAKTTLIQRVQDANLNIARAQRLLIEAVAEAASA